MKHKFGELADNTLRILCKMLNDFHESARFYSWADLQLTARCDRDRGKTPSGGGMRGEIPFKLVTACVQGGEVAGS